MDKETFSNKVGEYKEAILESLLPATTAQEKMERELKATGWAVMSILVGIHAGMRGLLRRLDNFWTREELAEAVEKYLVDLLTTGKGKLGQRLQEGKPLPEVHLRADEELRAYRRMLDIMRDILTRNPEFKDILT
jgi:DNA-binding TFAR19-related protein (PDSD5 family)